jgi:hypothetical protein
LYGIAQFRPDGIAQFWPQEDLNISPMALRGFQDPNFPDPTFSDFALFRIHKIPLRLWH